MVQVCESVGLGRGGGWRGNSDTGISGLIKNQAVRSDGILWPLLCPRILGLILSAERSLGVVELLTLLREKET